MRRYIYIICAVAMLAMASACAPKATADGVQPDGDTVEVDPTDMGAQTIVSDSITIVTNN